MMAQSIMNTGKVLRQIVIGQLQGVFGGSIRHSTGRLQ